MNIEKKNKFEKNYFLQFIFFFFRIGQRNRQQQQNDRQNIHTKFSVNSLLSLSTLREKKKEEETNTQKSQI